MATLRSLPRPDILTVYGADWCLDCTRTKRHLSTSGIPYRYVNLEHDLAAQELLSEAGYRAIPVVATPDGRVLIEPSNAEFDALLRAAQRVQGLTRDPWMTFGDRWTCRSPTWLGLTVRGAVA